MKIMQLTSAFMPAIKRRRVSTIPSAFFRVSITAVSPPHEGQFKPPP
jgi:hypothetical protein